MIIFNFNGLVSLINLCNRNKIFVLSYASGGFGLKVQQTFLQPKIRRTLKNKCEQILAERG
jgi:hypothetical protein